MNTTLIIPTKNEEGAIGKVLKEIPKKLVQQIIVVDGHSKDETIKEIKANLRKGKDLLLTQESKGYGGAFLEGFKHAKGDTIIMMDADGSHNPTDIPFLIKKIEEGYEYVMASRYMPGSKSYDDTFIRWLGNKVFTLLTNIVHGTHVTDSLYLYTAITKKGLKKIDLNSSGFEFCTEILVKAHNSGLRFAEIPAIERKRYHGNSKVSALLDGLKILKMIFKNYN
jgi:glycosyltransferase involved in cell wall biosynthesis